MSVAAFDHIAEMFIQVFGTPAIVGIFILAFLVISLVILRAHAFVMLGIILPVVGVMAFASSDFVFMSKTVIIFGIVMLAFVLSLVFLSFQR